MVFSTTTGRTCRYQQRPGRLASVTDQTAGGTVGRHTDYTYDKTGRVLTTKVYAGSGTGSLKQTTTRTYTLDGTPASVAFDGTGDGLGTPPTVSYTYDSLGRPDLVKKGTTTMTDYAFNPDDTVSGRTDTNPVSTGTTYASTFAYDWAKRPTSITSAAVFSGTATASYRLDGLLGTKTMPNGETVSLAYDAAKRPTTATLANGSTVSQTYDRVGNVQTEARALSGVTGDNGTGTNDFSYDPLRRLVGETGLAKTDSYQYDLDGNRTRKVQGSTTIDYAYDATDQLKKQTIAGLDTIYSYSAYGDLTQSGTSVSTVTSYGYDTASHMISTNGPGGTSDDASFSLDALGRFATRSVAGSLDSTYGYVGDGETVVALVGATTRVSAIGPDGSRVATKDASTTAYLLPDLHGNVIGAEASGSTTIVNAIRYDGYGQTLGTPYTASGNVAMDVKYQGRLDVSASAEPLYDMSARFYSPAQGTFTQLDSVMGGAQDPLSMNRFLYAEANPATFIDPTGHFISENDSTPTTSCTHIGDPGCGSTAPTSRSTVRAATKKLPGNYHWSGQTKGKKADDRIQDQTIPNAGSVSDAVAKALSSLQTDGCSVDDPCFPVCQPVPFAMNCAFTGAYQPTSSFECHSECQEAHGWATAGLVAGTAAAFACIEFCAAAGAAVASAVSAKSNAMLDALKSAVTNPGWGPTRPDVQDGHLKVMMQELWRDTAVIGNGGTGDAIRAGAGHIQKGADYIKGLQNWIDANPNADPADIHAAETTIVDLVSALANEPFPKP